MTCIIINLDATVSAYEIPDTVLYPFLEDVYGIDTIDTLIDYFNINYQCNKYTNTITIGNIKNIRQYHLFYSDDEALPINNFASEICDNKCHGIAFLLYSI
jgi:hypothetical protein